MFWLLVSLVALLAVVTLLPISRNEAWWVRGHDFPRLQYAALAAVLLAAQWILLERSASTTWLLMGVTFACFAYQAWWILPHTPLHRPEVKRVPADDRSERLRVMSVNVLMPNRRADDLMRIIGQAQPDVLIAVETDRWWQDQLDRLERDYVHTIKCPLDNLYGMHLYSRLPLEDGAIQYLVEEGVPSIHTMLVLRSGRRVRLHCLHPKPPSPTENPDSVPRDAELVVVAKSVAESERDTPVIVAGDLNDVAWSSTTRLFRKISGLLDPRVGRGMYNTFHAHWPFLRWPLDHLFHSEHFAMAKIERLPSFGSDHFPILIELALVPGLEAEQEGLEADAHDERRAADKAARVGVGGGDVHTPDPAGKTNGRASIDRVPIVGKVFDRNAVRRVFALAAPVVGTWFATATPQAWAQPAQNDTAERVPFARFAIDRTEVTVARFRAFARKTGLTTAAEREGGGFEFTGGWVRRPGWTFERPQGSPAADDEPAVHVTWDEAARYCAHVGGRLPTGSEWRLAAYTEQRAQPQPGFVTGRTYDYPVGDRPDGMNNNRRSHLRVGSTRIGVNGLYDMGGNVWEWLADRRGREALTAGGSWWYGPDQTRAEAAQWKAADFYAVYIGFRCAYGDPKGPS